MTLPRPKIGVAIPSFKREKYLRILLATIPDDIDVVVSDNGNNYSTEFREEFSGCKFIGTNRVVDVIENWNNAASNLETEWICVASDDDIFFHNSFEMVEKYLLLYPDAELFIFGHKNINEHGDEINTWKINKPVIADAPGGYDVFKYGVDARVIGVFFKRDLYNRIGKFDERYKVTASDSDFIQLALLNAKSVVVPEVVAGYRVWTSSMTGQLITTKEWHHEVRYWQTKIAKELQDREFTKAEIRKNTNEVIARNLLAGLTSLRKRNADLFTSLNFLRQFQYPVFASVKTHLKILKCLSKTALKI